MSISFFLRCDFQSHFFQSVPSPFPPSCAIPTFLLLVGALLLLLGAQAGVIHPSILPKSPNPHLELASLALSLLCTAPAPCLAAQSPGRPSGLHYITSEVTLNSFFFFPPLIKNSSDGEEQREKQTGGNGLGKKKKKCLR